MTLKISLKPKYSFETHGFSRGVRVANSQIPHEKMKEVAGTRASQSTQDLLLCVALRDGTVMHVEVPFETFHDTIFPYYCCELFVADKHTTPWVVLKYFTN